MCYSKAVPYWLLNINNLKIFSKSFKTFTFEYFKINFHFFFAIGKKHYFFTKKYIIKYIFFNLFSAIKISSHINILAIEFIFSDWVNSDLYS